MTRSHVILVLLFCDAGVLPGAWLQNVLGSNTIRNLRYGHELVEATLPCLAASSCSLLSRTLFFSRM